jgi:hypothetical protein
MLFPQTSDDDMIQCVEMLTRLCKADEDTIVERIADHLCNNELSNI